MILDVVLPFVFKSIPIEPITLCLTGSERSLLGTGLAGTSSPFVSPALRAFFFSFLKWKSLK